MIEILDEQDWHLIEPQLDEMNCLPPNKGRSVVLVERCEDEIISFVVIESIAKIGQVWSKGGNPRSLFKFIERSARPETSYMILSCEERFDSLCEKFGFYPMPGKMFRRDL